MGSGFEKELRDLINMHSMENGSNTPDFILASYLSTCLATFNAYVNQRTCWYSDDVAEVLCTKPEDDNAEGEE